MEEAGSERAGGHLVEALRDYDRVVAIGLPTDSRRPEALYWAGMLRLEPAPDLRDVARAQVLLKELAAEYPAFPRLGEATIAVALSGELTASKDEAETARRESAQCAAACADEKQDLAGRLETAQAEAKSARDKEIAGAKRYAEAQADIARRLGKAKKTGAVVEKISEPKDDMGTERKI